MMMLTGIIRQNNALLNSLSSKVSALKSVTIDIYDNARDQETLDNAVRILPISFYFWCYLFLVGRYFADLHLSLRTLCETCFVDLGTDIAHHQNRTTSSPPSQQV